MSWIVLHQIKINTSHMHTNAVVRRVLTIYI